MKISLKWVNELVDTEVTHLEDLIEKLTFGGFEVEEIIETQINKQKQITLDISATANRSDSMSVQGISTEIGALLNQPLKNLKYSTQGENWLATFASGTQLILDENDCQAFIALTVENLINTTSPTWLKQKLIHSKLVPEDNFQDFQTYVQLEMGYPFEIYDFGKISSKFNGNQNVTIKISQIKNVKQVFVNNLSIGYVGINCNEDFQCSDETKKILIEGSIFKAATIRRQSKLVKLRTERSIRYEKSIKDSSLIEALYRFVSLLRIKNPNLTCKLHVNSRIQNVKPIIITLNYTLIKSILGPVKRVSSDEITFILPQQITEYLTRLNFKSTYNSFSKTWAVTVPTLRNQDIVSEIDLVEEIGRLHGFNNFVTQLPKLKCLGIEDSSCQIRKKLTNGFLSLGLSEFVHYSLINSTFQNQSTIKLINPSISEYSILRTSLLPNLVQTLASNIRQGNVALEGFEYGHVFYNTNYQSLHEKEVVAGLIGPTLVKSTWSTPSRQTTWFEAKGRLEQLFKKLNLLVLWQSSSSEKLDPVFHPYRTSWLRLEQNLKLGIFGQINPSLAKRLDIPLETFLFELSLENIEKGSRQTFTTTFKKYSLYPKLVRDISFLSPKNISFEEIKRVLYLNGTEYLINIKLLDRYTGNLILENYASLCIQFTFQSNSQTLQNKKIDQILEKLKDVLEKNFEIYSRT